VALRRGDVEIPAAERDPGTALRVFGRRPIEVQHHLRDQGPQHRPHVGRVTRHEHISQPVNPARDLLDGALKVKRGAPAGVDLGEFCCGFVPLGLPSADGLHGSGDHVRRQFQQPALVLGNPGF